MWRLLRFYVRFRWTDKWLSNFWIVVLISVMNIGHGLTPGSAQLIGSAMAVSCAFGVIIGPGFVFGLRFPELRFLPLSRRDIWRAGWILAVPTPALVIGLAFAIDGFVFRHPWHSASIALVALVTGLYLGALMGIGALFPTSRRDDHWDLLARGLNLVMAAIFVGSPFWGFAMENALPTSWSDVRGATAVAFALGVLLTVVGAAYSPGEEVPFGRGIAGVLLAQRPGGPNGRLSTSRKTSATTDWGLTGLAALARSTVNISAICLALFVALDALFFHSLLVLQPTHRPPLARGHGENLPMFVAFGITALLQGSRTGRQSIRHLRTLPIGDWQLTGTILGLPILQGLLWWAGLAAVHLALGGWLPPILRPELFCTLIAAGTIITTGMFLPDRGWLLLVGMLVIFALVPIDDDSVPGAATTAILNGLAIAVLAGTAWMIQRALNRSQALYQTPPARLRVRGRASHG